LFIDLVQFNYIINPETPTKKEHKKKGRNKIFAHAQISFLDTHTHMH